MPIALLPVGSRGDVHPMIALGRELRDASHDVVVGTAPQLRDDVVHAGLGFVPVGRDARDYMSANAREYTAGVLRGALVVHRHLMEEMIVGGTP